MLMATLVLVASFPAAAQTLDELARNVRDAATNEARIDQEREAIFVRELNRQQALLEEARQELVNENVLSDRLRIVYNENERALADLETTLAERMGNLGELFGVVRQASGELQAALDNDWMKYDTHRRKKLGYFLAFKLNFNNFDVNFYVSFIQFYRR